MTITRREAVIKLATLMGATALGPRLLASPTHPGASTQHGFSADEVALLDEIGETIIPATDVPGAKATQIGSFMAMMVHDCYVPAEQAIFRDGMKQIADTHRQRFGSTFIAGRPVDRTAVLEAFDREQRAYQAQRAPDQPPHFFRIMKELTILGYFSSELGATKALRFIETPGAFDGAAPYTKGDKAWFS